MIYLIIYVSDNCSACTRVVSSAKKIADELNNVNVQIKKITELNGQIIISPAIFVNNELFCYGDIDPQKLRNKIKLIFTN